MGDVQLKKTVEANRKGVAELKAEMDALKAQMADIEKKTKAFAAKGK